jgi:hypothetical protein
VPLKLPHRRAPVNAQGLSSSGPGALKLPSPLRAAWYGDLGLTCSWLSCARPPRTAPASFSHWSSAAPFSSVTIRSSYASAVRARPPQRRAPPPPRSATLPRRVAFQADSEALPAAAPERQTDACWSYLQCVPSTRISAAWRVMPLLSRGKTSIRHSSGRTPRNGLSLLSGRLGVAECGDRSGLSPRRSEWPTTPAVDRSELKVHCIFTFSLVYLSDTLAYSKKRS